MFPGGQKDTEIKIVLLYLYVLFFSNRREECRNCGILLLSTHLAYMYYVIIRHLLFHFLCVTLKRRLSRLL